MTSRRPNALAAALGAIAVAGCARYTPIYTAPAMPAAPTAPTTPTPPSPAIWDEGARAHLLLVPVAGVRAENIPDSYNAKRDGGRVHNAVDILAARGTPVVAASTGVILKVHHSTLGGNTVYQRDASGDYILYYAHLDHYRDGLAEGQLVAQGDTIGYVGTTGNAPADTPHLHFQMMRAAPDAKWNSGTPVDPRALFFNAGGAVALPPLKTAP